MSVLGKDQGECLNSTTLWLCTDIKQTKKHEFVDQEIHEQSNGKTQDIV